MVTRCLLCFDPFPTVEDLEDHYKSVHKVDLDFMGIKEAKHEAR